MTRRPPLLLMILALAMPTFGVVSASAAPQAPSCGPGGAAANVDGLWLCTHADTAPAGVDTTQLPSTPELFEGRYGVADPEVVATVATDGTDAVAGTSAVACQGDGDTGPRVQLIYARADNVPGRYSAVVPLIRQYAADADDIVNLSAGRVGDGRRIRFVTNNECEPKVMNVTLTGSGDDSFPKTVAELRNQGLIDDDRKYLVFVDAAVGICGLGEVYLDDEAGQDNPNNAGRPMYARVDTACWQHAAAHELLHTMGAVQNSAPNSSGAGHCTDEVDVMCYKDTASTVTEQVCTRAGQVDCNNNDYFHPNPKASSYLATNWNVANSRFLESGSAPPPPATTTVSVPSSGLAGVPWRVRVDLASTGASVTWSSTRDDCRFDNPTSPVTTWSCRADATGAGEILANVTENGLNTPYSMPVVLETPTTPRPPSLAAAASRTEITSGNTVTLTGTLTDVTDGKPIYGMPVDVWERPSGASNWTRVSGATTNLAGKVSHAVAPRRNTMYMFSAAGTATWGAAGSQQVEVRVATKVRGKLSSTKVRRTGVAKVYGAVSPDKAGKVITLKRFVGGRWVAVAKDRVRADSTYTLRYSPRKAGDHRLRVVKPGDTHNLRGRTPPVVLSVR